MPAQRPRASFEPIAPDFDLKSLVESTPNFSYVDRISCDMIEQQGLREFEKLVLLHVIIGGKPLVIDGFDERLDPWTFSPKWLRDNMGEKVENARVLNTQDNLPLTMGHYLKNMSKLTNQFFEKPNAYKEKKRQRVYLKDIDCPAVWQDKLRDHIPEILFYLNESTGVSGGPGAVPDPTSSVQGRRLGKGIARAGDLMSSLPADMRAENLMCYIGHEGTYTPAHREMCASLGQNLMVEASDTLSDDGKPEKPGSSIWFMTESKDRHVVSEYWLSVLGHDIEVENHFAQVVAWKKAPFGVHVVEQRPGDFILIPPLAPHQVWNRGTRTMKVAWNRTTAETLEMALNEALPRSRIVCRDEQYKNKAIVYYTLQKYSGLLTAAHHQASQLPDNAAHELLSSDKVKQLQKDFKRLFGLYRQILLSEMFNPDDRDAPKSPEYLPFDGNVTCAYCRGNIFNRFLSCNSCKDMLGHHAENVDGDPYDVCMDCYAMGRSCACLSNLKWVEQFKWKELASKYESWRKLMSLLSGGQITDKTPLTLLEEKKRFGKKTLAEVCKEQLKRRPWKDVHAGPGNNKDRDEEEEEIVVGDDGTVKKVTKKRSKTWLKNNWTCHVCCHRHESWKMIACTTCERSWCFGSLFRGWDKMPIEIMENPDWQCPHCLGICFAGACRREGKMNTYEPKGTLLGHDTRKVADARSVEALVDFSVSNLTWLKDDDTVNRAESSRVKRARAEATRAKQEDPTLDDEDGSAIEPSGVDYEVSPETEMAGTSIDPALIENTAPSGSLHDEENDEETLIRRLQQSNSAYPEPATTVSGVTDNGAPEGYVPVSAVGYVPQTAHMYPQPDGNNSYSYPSLQPISNEPTDGASDKLRGLRPFKRPRDEYDDTEQENVNMQKHPKAKKPKLTAAGFRSSDLGDATVTSKAKSEVQRQFKKEKERRALEKARADGRFIMLTAALRDKKRIIKLRVSGARLAQLLAQKASKVGIHADQMTDDNSEAEEGTMQLQHDDHAYAPLLKSDITSKDPKSPKNNFQLREHDGLIVASKTKKAPVPAERDNSFDSFARDKQPSGSKSDATERRKSRNNQVDYEEIDEGSDEDEDKDGVYFSRKVATTAKEKEEKRFSDHGKDEQTSIFMSPAKAPAQPFRRPAGKRPTMRPAYTIATEKVGSETGSEDGSTGTASRDLPAVDRTLAEPLPFTAINGQTRNTIIKGRSVTVSRMTGRPRGRPRKHNMSRVTPSTTESASISQPRREAVDEQNRLAKLHALTMADGSAVHASQETGEWKEKAKSDERAPTTVSMADVLSDDVTESDDNIESVPARPAVARLTAQAQE